MYAFILAYNHIIIVSLDVKQMLGYVRGLQYLSLNGDLHSVWKCTTSKFNETFSSNEEERT